jgi:muramoyltetrapeptide carboxypeptidase LdcA involved in peptidoglycan recycling
MSLLQSIYLFCPSYRIADAEQLARAREQSRWLANELGLVVCESLTIDETHTGRWGDATERCADMTCAFEHAIILPARGGYGAVHLAAMLLTPRERTHGPVSRNSPRHVADLLCL